MTYPGTDKKWQLTATQSDFSLAEDNFEIVIKDHYGRVRYTVKKDDCFSDSDGRFYFVTENLRQGAYYAYFKGSYEDDDYTKQRRVFTDEQKLCEVAVPCYPCKSSTFGVDSKCRCGHVVQYTEVTTVSLDDGEYLADVNGEYILTSDGKRIQFNANDNDNGNRNMSKVKLQMTGDEFKQLIEGENPNGTIDTLPEIKRAMEGQSDDGTPQLGNLTDEDMERWFDDDPDNDDPEE